MKFLRNLLASVIGTCIALGIIFMIFMIIIAIASSGDENKAIVHENSILELKLDKPVKDFVREVPAFFGELGLVDDVIALNKIIKAIKTAKTDTKIKGISIHSTYLMAGTAQIKAIRDELKDFKESGKFVYAYGDYYMQKDYYLASVADSIFLNPVGDLDFRGLSSEVLFYKDFQDKTGVQMEVIRHGKYKSAVEPFLGNEMSEANREQITELLSSIWNSVLSDISESRNLSVEKLNTIADDLGGRNPEMAVANKLIDRDIFIDQYESLLKKATNTESDGKINYIGVDDYAKQNKSSGKDRVAVIYAQGEIRYGKGNEEVIGQGIIVEALRKARSNKKVKAIVLRVNSPGGSALASDIIWREIEITKEIKPVVVSMGNVAASGGYYISAGAQKIFAEPTTITGSIGVFGVVPNINVLADKWGINAEQVNTNKNATMYSAFEPVTDDFRAMAQESIEDVYTTFLKRVSEGRNIPVHEVDSIAQGRVWSGEQAKQKGLVDEIGGLDDAIVYAAELGETSDYSVKNYPIYETDFGDMFKGVPGINISKTKENIIKDEIGEEAYEMFKNIKSFSQLKGAQARMPFEINIK